MLSTTMFERGENDTQDYYFFRNEVTTELVQIIRNKGESHWFGSYINDRKDSLFIIPVYTDNDSQTMLERVCEWYNNGKPERTYEESPEANPKHISDTLFEMKDLFDKFPLNSAKRVQAYLEEPTVERWDDISGIIVNGSDTVWQLLCESDRSFPRSGRTIDITGKVTSEWAKIPTPLEVLRAVKTGIQKKSVQ